jgi:hypothetical protein
LSHIPGVQFVNFMAIVGLHQHDTPDALFLALHRVPHRIAFLPGDIAACVGLKDVTTGDTLCDPDAIITLERMEFPELFIGMQTERRIFRRQPLQRDAHFFLVRFGLRLNRP